MLFTFFISQTILRMRLYIHMQSYCSSGKLKLNSNKFYVASPVFCFDPIFKPEISSQTNHENLKNLINSHEPLLTSRRQFIQLLKKIILTLPTFLISSPYSQISLNAFSVFPILPLTRVVHK